MVIGNGTNVHDILKPYRDTTDGLSTDLPPQIGQIVCTPAPEFAHPLQLFHAQRADQTSHRGISGSIRNIDPRNDYKTGTRLPLLNLRLRDGEELLALRSKMRRCIVLAMTDGIPTKHLPSHEQNIARNALSWPSYLVAPAYSVSTPSEPRAMTVTVAMRAAHLVYPHLVFLPKSGGVFNKDSVARLDRAFWTALAPPTEIYKHAMSGERMAMIQSQLDLLMKVDPDDEYVDLVKLLRSFLPAEYAPGLP